MKKIITVMCTSFTSVILLFILFYQFDMVSELNHSTILQIFSMSVLISVFMYISDMLQKKFDIGSSLLDLLIRILICYLVVFTVGCIGGMFTFGLNAILEMTPILIIAFIITYIFSYAVCVNYANQINAEIQNKQER